MNELGAYFIENIEKLNAFDWILIIIGAMLIFIGIKTTVVWVYRHQFAGQKDLINTLNSLVEEKEKDRLRLKAETAELTGQLRKISSELTANQNEYRQVIAAGGHPKQIDKLKYDLGRYRGWAAGLFALHMAHVNISHTKQRLATAAIFLLDPKWKRVWDFDEALAEEVYEGLDKLSNTELSICEYTKKIGDFIFNRKVDSNTKPSDFATELADLLESHKLFTEIEGASAKIDSFLIPFYKKVNVLEEDRK